MEPLPARPRPRGEATPFHGLQSVIGHPVMNGARSLKTMGPFRVANGEKAAVVAATAAAGGTMVG